jgi:hypothetical protein
VHCLPMVNGITVKKLGGSRFSLKLSKKNLTLWAARDLPFMSSCFLFVFMLLAYFQ